VQTVSGSAAGRLASCLYAGTIAHQRRGPARSFQHRIVLAYIDLEELPALAGGLLVQRRPGSLRFRRRDYHGPPAVPLSRAVRETVRQHTGARPAGPIRVLTNLGFFGHCFNPVSFYYCFDGDGRLQALLAEVTNTPWGERRAYVIPGGAGEFRKAMHVSPFMGMDHTYRAFATTPGPELRVAIESLHEDEPVFAARLSLTRRELTRRSLRGLAWRHPPSGIRALALIYGHALGLRIAGAPVFAHPERSDT
jgi:uncharacterized protein